MTTSLILELQRRARNPSSATDEAYRAMPLTVTPVAPDALAFAEQALGFSLPPFLCEVYAQVANGGFGPGYGLLPIGGDDKDTDSLIGLYRSCRSGNGEEASWLWPAQLVPFCDWGCAIRSCVDCSSATGPVYTFDPSPLASGGTWSDCLGLTHSSVEAWFADWISGVKIWDLMFEPDTTRTRTVVNPFTKKSMPLVSMKLRRG